MNRLDASLLIKVSLVFLLLAGCVERDASPDVSHIDMAPVEIRRYEQALFSINIDNLSSGLDSIHNEFSFFLGDEYRDTLNFIRIRNFLLDPTIQELNKKTTQVYPDLTWLEKDLTDAFRHCKYHFPAMEPPAVYSYISGLYYESPVEYFDAVLIISLDLYLGSHFEPYRAIGLPKYATRRMTAGFIIPECMRQVGVSYFPPELQQRTLLDHMLFHGKLLHFLDRVLPGYPDTLLTGYSPAQEQWCAKNEESIWALLLENELLFSRDPFVVNKFIQDGPFTSGLSAESPAMIGRWVGWKIVGAFMARHPETTMKELFNLSDSQYILSESRYKPIRN